MPPGMDISSGRPRRRRFRINDLLKEDSSTETPELDRDFLRDKTRWIRDVLDPGIAREGPGYLDATQIVTLVKFLDNIIRAPITLDQLRYSRIHFAVMCIAGCATRWPNSLIEMADKIIQHWTIRYGPLGDITGVLYEEGGRLHGICQPQDIDKEVLEIRWLFAKDSKTCEAYAHRYGELGCIPGDWWINTSFAYHAGMLDSGDPTGRIVSDKKGAYALLLTDGDEVDSDDPHRFTYQPKQADRGRLRLTKASFASRNPVRVLRSHTLRSCWAPVAGVRYDGLYKVVGWRIRYETEQSNWHYEIDFERLETEVPMSLVLEKPIKEEIDDYREYKRLRQIARQSHRNGLPRTTTLVEKQTTVFSDLEQGTGGTVIKDAVDAMITLVAFDDT